MLTSVQANNDRLGGEAEEEEEPQLSEIILERGADGLGFSIVGGHGSPHGDLPIYVKVRIWGVGKRGGD